MASHLCRRLDLALRRAAWLHAGGRLGPWAL